MPQMNTYTVRVLLICFTQNEAHGIDKAWFESRELPWHMGYPLSGDNIHHAVAQWPRVEGVQSVVFKWGPVSLLPKQRFTLRDRIRLGIIWLRWWWSQ
jgi:hypothetical protein